MDDTERFQCEVLKRTLEQHGYLVLKRHTGPPVEEGEYLAKMLDSMSGRYWTILDQDSLPRTDATVLQLYGPLDNLPREPTP